MLPADSVDINQCAIFYRLLTFLHNDVPEGRVAVKKMMATLGIQRRRQRSADLIYVCNACQLHCKAVVSDERARSLLDEMPKIFCPSDDREPEFKLYKTRALAA
jgi:hypothetical protein